jgi:hypothetical protein
VKAAVGTVANSMRLIGRPQTLTPKFFSPESLHVVVAGADAGKFSCFCPGFGVGFPGMSTAFMSMPAHAKVNVVPNITTSLQTSSSSSYNNGKKVYISPDYVAGSTNDNASSAAISLAPRLKEDGEVSLNSKQTVVGLLDISKGGSSVFLKQVEKLFQNYSPTPKILLYRKPTFNRPAPEELRQQISSECSHVIVALAD